MGTNKSKPQSVTTPADLEETAELPILPASALAAAETGVDAMAGTDTWTAPSQAQWSTAAAAEGSAEFGRAEAPSPAAEAIRGQLEQKLRGLTANLRELEQLLSRKTEQLADFEHQIGARDQRIESLSGSLAADRAELDATRDEQARLTTALEALRADRTNVQTRLTAVEAQRSQLEILRAGDEMRLARTEAQLAELQRRTERYRENLQALEGRRQLFDGLLNERDQLIGMRESRIAALEREIADHTRYSGVREGDLQSLLGTQKQRTQDLETALEKARADIDMLKREAQAARTLADARLAAAEEARLRAERAAGEQVQAVRTAADSRLAAAEEARVRTAQAVEEQVQAARTAADTRLAAAEEARLRAERAAAEQAQAAIAHELELRKGFESELQSRDEIIGALQEKLMQSRGEAEQVRGTVRVAEENVRALEAELRQRESSLAAQMRNTDELRTQLQAVQRSLEERNAMIARLDSEAASSAEVLDNIQQSLEHPVEDHVRLLVRTEGDTGIVHVLGRRTTIGRTPDNDIRIENDFISRHHAVLLLSGSNTIIEDLNSTNGVYVNTRLVGRQTLTEGDLVTIGRTEFRFVRKPQAMP